MEEKKLLVRNNLPYNEVYVLNIYASFVPKCSICLAAGDCIDIFIFATRPVYFSPGKYAIELSASRNKKNTKKKKDRINSILPLTGKKKKRKKEKKLNLCF